MSYVILYHVIGNPVYIAPIFPIVEGVRPVQSTDIDKRWKMCSNIWPMFLTDFDPSNRDTPPILLVLIVEEFKNYRYIYNLSKRG